MDKQSLFLKLVEVGSVAITTNPNLGYSQAILCVSAAYAIPAANIMSQSRLARELANEWVNWFALERQGYPAFAGANFNPDASIPPEFS